MCVCVGSGGGAEVQQKRKASMQGRFFTFKPLPWIRQKGEFCKACG